MHSRVLTELAKQQPSSEAVWFILNPHGVVNLWIYFLGFFEELFYDVNVFPALPLLPLASVFAFQHELQHDLNDGKLIERSTDDDQA